MTHLQFLMLNISQAFASKIDLILEQWMAKVREDRKIESSRKMPDTALGDAIPKLLQSMAVALARMDEANFGEVAKVSLEHGSNRAKYDYNAAEISREYHLLRHTIFEVLEADILSLSVVDCQRVLRQIDAVIDEAASQCFHQFVEERTQKMADVQKELELTNQELNRLMELNKERFAQLAHELKTPLNSIMGYSQLLLRQQQKLPATESEKSVKQIEKVLGSSRQLLRLVNDVLEVFRFESCEINLRLQSANPRSIIMSVVETIEPLAQEKGLEMRVDCDRAPTQVTLDVLRLQQIVTNLLSNAVRYTETGYIEVSCATLPNEKWSLTVTDSGIGIPPEERVKIFEPFSQVDSDVPKEGSSGLGLAIVSQLVKLLQGEIELVSEVGDGSSFTVIFPLEVQE